MDSGNVVPPAGVEATAAATSTPAALAHPLREVRGGVVAWGLAAFALVWLISLAWAALAPPLDNVEQLVWVRSLEWGYYKHPPLPTWLLWPVVQVVGWNAWATYGLGAACTLTAAGAVWWLLRTLRGSRHATVALLAVLCITYYNGRLNYYNHNIVLLLSYSGCALMTWQAFATRRLRWWAGVGLALGLGALAKYQVVLCALSVLLFWGHQRAWRDPVHRRGLLLAALVALLCLLPHLAWLPSHHFGPIGYAMETSLGVQLGAKARSALALQWLADQVFNRFLPALLLLALIAWPLWREARAAAASSSAAAASAAPRRAPAEGSRAFLLAFGLSPLAFVVVLGMATGAELQLQWGTAFLMLLVPALMELAPRLPWSQARLRQALQAFLVMQALLMVQNIVTSPHGPQALSKQHWRNFDAARLAAQLGEPARTALGAPIHIVEGGSAKAGALALQLSERPRVLIDGRLDRSPWLSEAMVLHCGRLELIEGANVDGAMPVGPDFPQLSWRVVPRDTAAACPLDH